MLIKVLSYLPAIVGLSTIGLFALLNNSSSWRNRMFALLNFNIAIWLLLLFFADISTNQLSALWIFRFALFFGELMFLAFYFFALVFVSPSKITTSKQFFASLPILVTSALLLTPLGVESITIKDFGVQPESIGPIYTISDLLGFVYLFAGIAIMLTKHKKSTPREKSQIKFVLLGLGVAIVVNIITGFLLTLFKVETNAILLGGVSLFVFSVFVAYAMFKHGFLDIRLLVARAIAYLLSLSTLVLGYSSVVVMVSAYLFPDEQISYVRQLLYLSAAVTLGLLSHPVKRFFDKQTTRLFYRDAYSTASLLNEFNKVLVSTIDLEELLKRSSHTLTSYIKSDFSEFVLQDRKPNNKIRLIGNTKISSDDALQLLSAARHLKETVVVGELLEANTAELRMLMQKLEVGLVVKITAHTSKEAIGYWVLGYKRSGSLYNSQDIAVLEIIANEMAIAIQNALRFEEIEQFNLTLQEKVDDATRKLRHTNEKLKELDETKDEFISMASHQLRTPLTSVKGYVSMVLEGDAGKISAQQRQLLDQAFVSSQRMVYLIADLLNVSRLKTGKFVIEAVPTNLADVIEGEISQLVQTAKARNLELVYDKPKNFPVLNLDETKIRQVIMNFIDNAIYYTPSGGRIEVGLKETDHSVEFTVTDNGIGIPKHEQHHLFNKFFRAGNARKARPDGTGLGLFMAKKVIVAQGGAVIFKSEEGKGSTFGFSFPKHKLEAKTVEKS